MKMIHTRCDRTAREVRFWASSPGQKVWCVGLAENPVFRESRRESGYAGVVTKSDRKRKRRRMRLTAWRVLYWVVTIPYGLTLAFFVIAIPYCVANFIRGGMPAVKGWLIHIQIEGRVDSWREDDWTWPHILKPVLVFAALSISLWIARRVLRHQFQDERPQ